MEKALRKETGPFAFARMAEGRRTVEAGEDDAQGHGPAGNVPRSAEPAACFAAGQTSDEACVGSAEDACSTGTSPVTVHGWQTHSTSSDIALRLAAGVGIAPDTFSFLLEPEQVRQLIRDLSKAVHASDLERLR